MYSLWSLFHLWDRFEGRINSIGSYSSITQKQCQLDGHNYFSFSGYLLETHRKLLDQIPGSCTKAWCSFSNFCSNTLFKILLLKYICSAKIANSSAIMVIFDILQFWFSGFNWSWNSPEFDWIQYKLLYFVFITLSSSCFNFRYLLQLNISIADEEIADNRKSAEFLPLICIVIKIPSIDTCHFLIKRANGSMKWNIFTLNLYAFEISDNEFSLFGTYLTNWTKSENV